MQALLLIVSALLLTGCRAHGGGAAMRAEDDGAATATATAQTLQGEGRMWVVVGLSEGLSRALAASLTGNEIVSCEDQRSPDGDALGFGCSFYVAADGAASKYGPATFLVAPGDGTGRATLTGDRVQIKGDAARVITDLVAAGTPRDLGCVLVPVPLCSFRVTPAGAIAK